MRASLSLVRAEGSFACSLVVRRIASEDDVPDGSADEYVFPLRLTTRLGQGVTEPALMWLPAQADHPSHVGSPFYFDVMADDGMERVEAFFALALRFLWEAEHEAECVDDDEEVLFWHERAQQMSPKKAPGAAGATATPAAKASAASGVSSPASGAAWSLGAALERFGPLALSSLAPNTTTFVERCNETFAQINGLEDGSFSYFLVVFEDARATAPCLAFPMSVELDFSYDAAHDAVMWRSFFEGVHYVWSLRAAPGGPADVADAFRRALTQYLWQAKAEKRWDTLAADEQAWILDSMTEPVADVEGGAGMDLDEPDAADDRAFDVRRETGSASSAYYDPDLASLAPDERAHNSLMELGKFKDRAFVCRGSQIGVFRYSESDRLDFVTTINSCKALDGSIFSPAKMMLHQQDSSLLMLDPARENVVARMDLERGQIVEEYKTSSDEVNWKVLHMAPTTKFQGMSHDATFVGLNQRSLFRMDPRVSTSASMQRVEDACYSFSANSKPLLSCVASTEAGDYVVGSSRGEIRLFSRDSGIAKRPKTTFPGCGDAITGIDVTASGDYVLATTATYLLLIPTKVDDEATGFTKPLGKNKPRPIRLRLQPADAAAFGGAINFRPARFDTTLGVRHERVIATSTGPYLVCWNFARAARGDSTAYTWARADQAIVAEDWMPNDTNAVMLTLPDDVKIAKR